MFSVHASCELHALTKAYVSLLLEGQHVSEQEDLTVSISIILCELPSHC